MQTSAVRLQRTLRRFTRCHETGISVVVWAVFRLTHPFVIRYLLQIVIWGQILNSYIFLAGTTVAEVIGTALMKFSDGFTRLWPSVATIVCYCTAFYLLSQTLSIIPTGTAYTIRSGAGIVLISPLGWLVSRQKPDSPAIAGMLLICAGALVINIFSKSSPH